MKRLLILLLCFVFLTSPLYAADTITVDDKPVVTTDDDDVGSLTRRQRRKLGVTFRNVRRIAIDLKKKGELSDDPAVASAQVLTVLTNENPKAFQEEAAAINWDALLDFIERLLELILKFLPLFVDTAQPPIIAAAPPGVFVLVA